MHARLAAQGPNRRGFTLIELMVALTAGLIVSAAAFMMARNATTFFQHEAGITSAQYGAMVGMARLQAELRNAGYLSTPNIQDDLKYCGDRAQLTSGAGFEGINDLAGVRIIADGSFTESGDPNGLFALNGLRPDSITITGSFDTTEQFAAAQIVPAGGAYDVVLNFVNDGAAIRTMNRAAQGGASFSEIFRPGRLLRVRDEEGQFSLGVITSVAPDIPNEVVITVNAVPALGKREVNSNCGCTGFCIGAPVNVIARMHYNLRSVVGLPEYANLTETADYLGASAYHRGPAAEGAADRTELTRVELAPDGSEIAGTLQVLAEHAVDLEFGATYETAVSATGVPTLRREPVGDTTNLGRYSVGDKPTTGTGRPDLIHALQVRLSTRAHRRDRDTGIDDAADGHPYRFNLGTVAGVPQGFARMRTLIADIELPNMKRVAP